MDYQFYNRQLPVENSGTLILDSKTADVNGDGISDTVFLTGLKPGGPDSIVIDNIKINIKDGKTGKMYEINLKVNKGYSPRLFLGTFDNNPTNDILVSIDSGNTGQEGYFYVYSFMNNNSRKLFDFEEFNNKYKYDVTYKNNFMVDVTSKFIDKQYVIDLSNKNRSYLSQLYNQNGTLKKPMKGYVSAIIDLHPVVSETNYGYDLYAVQRIVGFYNADTLGMMVTPLSYKNGTFVIINDNPYLTLFGKETINR